MQSYCMCLLQTAAFPGLDEEEQDEDLKAALEEQSDAVSTRTINKEPEPTVADIEELVPDEPLDKKK